jgi:hypothetical protein
MLEQDSWLAIDGKQKIVSFSTFTSYYLCMKKLLENPNDQESLFSFKV